ncbi:23015_t:CDS:2, partial [Racocetra persica]
MVWYYCTICGESGKIVSTQTERLHRQEQFGRIDHSIDNTSNIKQRNEQKSEYEKVKHETEQEIDNEEIEQIKKFRVALNYGSEDSETEQENDFENLSLIKNTGLLDDIELEDSDIEEETILNFKTFTLPYTAITALLMFIKALVFNDDLNFPETLYKAKDAISFKKTIIQFIKNVLWSFILVLCDIPARNKICGFSSHSSKHAYFKCKKLFKTNDTLDQSNIDNYTLQTIKEHKIIAEKWKYSVSSEHKQLFDQY